MKLNTTGLIIKEQNLDENDKIVTALTKDYGVIKAFAKNAKNIRKSLSTGVSLLSFSKLDIFVGKESYIINDAGSIEIFFELRKDIFKMAMAQYFCELAGALCPTDAPANEQLSIILNALHLLCKTDKTPLLIKPCVELRLLCAAGYMPDLVMCSTCGAYEQKTMHFLPKSGKLCCAECYNKTVFTPEDGTQNYSHANKKTAPEPGVEIDMGIVTALRHITFVPAAKLFSFELPQESLVRLNQLTELYLAYTVQQDFVTLKFLKGFL